MFKRVLRHLEHLGRVHKFRPPKEELDPQRVVNRTLYGTDYHPEAVSFAMNRVMNKLANHIDKEVVAKAIEDGMMNGFAMLSHDYDEDGGIKLVYHPPQNDIVEPLCNIGCAAPGEEIPISFRMIGTCLC